MSILVRKLDLGSTDRKALRVAIKDSIDIAGYSTRAGSAALEHAAPAISHAAVVEALLEGSCRIVGKTNMHELAYGVTGINDWTGTPVNPRYPNLIPGGSSSGSAAAVASGISDIAIGTDTGGSIRVPAACCGVFGLKPSFGRINRAGAIPATSSLDCIGPFARNMQGIEAAMAIIDPTYVSASLPTHPRLGIVAVDADADVADRLAQALETLGYQGARATLPGFAAAFDAALAIIAAETWTAFSPLLASGKLGADVAARLTKAADVNAAQREQAEHVRQAFAAEVDAALADVDALVLPTLPCLPPSLAGAADVAAAIKLTALVRPFNLSGHPALSIPLETAAGQPVGLQLIGRIGEDAALCALGRRIAADLGIRVELTLESEA
ncbi:amidase [Sphingomonas sp.]|uniref:amidase n=1 Tax=Sphingomonas sp. TaxID=28214 RepID=UPI000DB4E969|nr:amidase [Sphingomonas sp.]PZU10772.1 MAG: amidase [Sphingomonas sp.]